MSKSEMLFVSKVECYRPEAEKPPNKKTLQRIMEELEHTRVDVIKLDIEGEELRALEQASKSLSEGVDQLLLEVHMHISEHAHDSAKPEHFEQVRLRVTIISTLGF